MSVRRAAVGDAWAVRPFGRDEGAARRTAPSYEVRGLLDGAADLAELLVGRLAEELHGDDADDGDQGDEERVLHEAGAPLVLAEAGPHVRSDEFEVGEHRGNSLFRVRCPR